MNALNDNIELRIPSKAEYVSVVRAFVTDFARRLGLCASAVEDVQVAVSEACTNVVLHAYAEEQHGGEMILRCMLKDGRLMMEIADRGQGIAKRVKYVTERNGGFGLGLIHALMDNVSLDSSPERGTVVRMSKKTGRSRLSRCTIRTAL